MNRPGVITIARCLSGHVKLELCFHSDIFWRIKKFRELYENECFEVAMIVLQVNNSNIEGLRF